MDNILCPYCRENDYNIWANELGFNAVRCRKCALIYVNPRPTLASISEAVKTGAHSSEAVYLNVKAKPDSAKVSRYRRIFSQMFHDVWDSEQPVSWLDVGAGYGEVVEAVSGLAPSGSKVEGLEPMKPKAAYAQSRGLLISEDYLRPSHAKVDFISAVDVYSHLPDFSEFLCVVKSVLRPGGEIFIETGNLADLHNRDEFPGELGLPDHLVFAGECHLRGTLEKAGFEIVRIKKTRIDGVVNLVKNIVKKLIGRPSNVRLPYTSSYRSLLVRARMTSKCATIENS